jgi:hypothetical protein
MLVATPDSGNKPTLAQVVEHGDLFGEPQWILTRQGSAIVSSLMRQFANTLAVRATEHDPRPLREPLSNGLRAQPRFQSKR